MGGGKTMPSDLKDRFEYLREQAKERYDNATTKEERLKAEREIDSLETVFKAYYYSYDMMEALS